MTSTTTAHPEAGGPSASGVEPEARPRAGGDRLLVALFVVTTFLGATLLFLVEPMAAKMLLPLLGGSPAVWNTATVFFQASLLGGYAFAHLTLSRLGPRRQPPVQVVALLVPLAVLPIAVPAGWLPEPGASPVLWTLGTLTVMLGAPFLMLSTVSPTLQRWFSTTSHPHATDPYFLYAAGNVGSLLGLLAYPLVLEPLLSTQSQARLWTGGYVTFVACTVACAVAMRRHRAPEPHVAAEPLVADPGGDAGTDVLTAASRAAVSDEPPPRISNRTRLRWVYLAAIPSSLLLGVTRHIATDIASMPLLWVIPLSLYLITFIVAFGARPQRPVRVSSRLLKLLVIPLALSFYGLVASLWLELALHLATFFCAALVAHGRLSEERPPPARLTEFYLWLSVGGVVGGIVTALIAPLLFTLVVEYPIAIVLALTLLPRAAFPPGGADDREEAGDRPRWQRLIAPRDVTLLAGVGAAAVLSVTIRAGGTQEDLTVSILIAAGAAVAAYVLARSVGGYALSIAALLLVAFVVPANPTLFQERTFFGVNRVYADNANDGRHVLMNGTTVHGMEAFTGAGAHQPTTYYAPSGPIGQYFGQLDADPQPHEIGVVGLGSGALAAYGRPGDHFTYYEIDPAVIDIAEDRNLFTFVPDSKARVDMVLGDGRIELEQRTAARYDLLTVDAFSGDAIPVHLITDEAVSLYLQRLAPHGVLAFHISNRYFDFAPVLGRLATEHGLTGIIQDNPATAEESAAGKLEATWVLLARTPGDLGAAVHDPRWHPLGSGAGAPLWTDSYSDLLHVFRWHRS
jgi:hypothetical protein